MILQNVAQRNRQPKTTARATPRGRAASQSQWTRSRNRCSTKKTGPVRDDLRCDEKKSSCEEPQQTLRIRVPPRYHDCECVQAHNALIPQAARIAKIGGK